MSLKSDRKGKESTWLSFGLLGELFVNHHINRAKLQDFLLFLIKIQLKIIEITIKCELYSLKELSVVVI